MSLGFSFEVGLISLAPHLIDVEGQLDLVSSLIRGIIGAAMWLLGAVNVLTKPPWRARTLTSLGYNPPK